MSNFMDEHVKINFIHSKNYHIANYQSDRDRMVTFWNVYRIDSFLASIKAESCQFPVRQPLLNNSEQLDCKPFSDIFSKEELNYLVENYNLITIQIECQNSWFINTVLRINQFKYNLSQNNVQQHNIIQLIQWPFFNFE